MRLEHVFVSTGISIRETRIRNRARYLPCINLHTDLDRWTSFHALHTLYYIYVCVCALGNKNGQIFQYSITRTNPRKVYTGEQINTSVVDCVVCNHEFTNCPPPDK